MQPKLRHRKTANVDSWCPLLPRWHEDSEGGGHCQSSVNGGIARLLLILLEQFAEAIEAAFPESAAVVDPFSRDGEAFTLDTASAHAADFLGLHQTAFFQHLQVLDDSGERD